MKKDSKGNYSDKVDCGQGILKVSIDMGSHLVRIEGPDGGVPKLDANQIPALIEVLAAAFGISVEQG